MKNISNGIGIAILAILGFSLFSLGFILPLYSIEKAGQMLPWGFASFAIYTIISCFGFLIIMCLVELRGKKGLCGTYTPPKNPLSPPPP